MTLDPNTPLPVGLSNTCPKTARYLSSGTNNPHPNGLIFSESRVCTGDGCSDDCCAASESSVVVCFWFTPLDRTHRAATASGLPPPVGARPSPSTDRSSDGYDAPRALIAPARPGVQGIVKGGVFHSVQGFEWYLSLERGFSTSSSNPHIYRISSYSVA